MAASKTNPIKNALGGISIAFARVMGVLPLPVARFVGRRLARAAYYLIPRIRRVGLANLDLAYGDTLSQKEKRRILRAATENVGVVAVEFPHIPHVLDAAFRERYITVEGFENLDPNRGGIMIGAHLGNWEWLAPVISALGRDSSEIVRPLDAPRLNAYVDQTRRAGGFDTIPKDSAGRDMLRRVKRGGFVGILIDQSPRTNGVPVTCFGHPCWATVAPAMVALLTDAPIHPVSMVRDQTGHYLFTIHPAMTVQRTGDRNADLQRLTQVFQDTIESLIRRYPEQWLWLHRRWKKRPRLEAEWQERMGRTDQSAEDEEG